jgi:hypothetical protein
MERAVSAYFSATAGAYILGLSSWMSLGLGFLLTDGVSAAQLSRTITYLLALGSLALAVRAFRFGEATLQALAVPVLLSLGLLLVAMPRSLLVLLAVVVVGSWLVRRATPAGDRRELPVNATTIAYILGAGAWGLVALFFLLTGPDENASQGCDLLDCFGGLGDELFWFMVLFPPFVLLSLGGVALATRALWVYGWSRADLGALALSASGPAVYAALALGYG